MMKIKILLWLMVTSLSIQAQSVKQRQQDFNLDNKLALQGYDPVSYFLQKKPLKGKKELAVQFEGVTYYFANPTHKDAFVKNPQNYEPQYGGWCAYAMGSNGEKVEVDSETYKILDGKLYLFYNAYFNNTLKSWNKDETKLKKQADKNWQKIIKS
ncbi:YHS domain protein [Flavobacterium sp. CYK-55]|uniref:YHS domain-containing (seleno)protein n=1 Tax=Flavobacterium sp. CYK-55 TaxID=2835529 RepID=UPI001BCD9CCA|nr:YHS domain-containing (seleno)protein [Flavobacterium sp. CYK-55]MBS7786546.1 YHS domain protein [Flavobacterium sp. CYK-55]